MHRYLITVKTPNGINDYLALSLEIEFDVIVNLGWYRGVDGRLYLFDIADLISLKIQMLTERSEEE
jgi:hypothetical protein